MSGLKSIKIMLYAQAPVWHWPKCWGLKNYRQLLNKFFFEQLWKVVENTKVVHYFDNSKGNFFFEAKISMVWLQIKFKIYQQVEGATFQCLTGACAENTMLKKLFQNRVKPKHNLWLEDHEAKLVWGVLKNIFIRRTTYLSNSIQEVPS